MSIKFIKKNSGIGVRQFATIEEINNTTGTDGALALVYESKNVDLEEGKTYNSIVLPNKIVFDEQITSLNIIPFDTGIAGRVRSVRVNATSIKFYKSDSMVATAVNTVSYASTDGITYTREDNLGELITISEIFEGAHSDIIIQKTNLELLQQMFKFNISNFEGIYQYKNNSWEIVPTQLTTSNDMVFEGSFYGINGLQVGTLQNTENLTKEQLLYRINIFNKFSNLSTTETNFSGLYREYSGTQLPTIDTSNATDFSYMFYKCENLTTIPMMNTSNVENMTYAFAYCKNITTLPLLDTSKVTNMANMVIGNENLTTIPKFNTSEARDMRYMFYECLSLEFLPMLDTSKVENMAYMLYKCGNLTEVPLWDISNVTNTSYMFQKCTNLRTIPVLALNATSMTRMFYECPNLTNETLNNILKMCTNNTKYTSTKTLKQLGLTTEQATICTTLSNYSAFTSAGWTTGY